MLDTKLVQPLLALTNRQELNDLKTSFLITKIKLYPDMVDLSALLISQGRARLVSSLFFTNI